ncbi:hypothetical protein Droror1_Dr00016436 [Drosera rotundifolia]
MPVSRSRLLLNSLVGFAHSLHFPHRFFPESETREWNLKCRDSEEWRFENCEFKFAKVEWFAGRCSRLGCLEANLSPSLRLVAKSLRVEDRGHGVGVRGVTMRVGVGCSSIWMCGRLELDVRLSVLLSKGNCGRFRGWFWHSGPSGCVGYSLEGNR